MSSEQRMWGGRFAGALDPRIDRLNRSFSFDQRLWAEDIAGSIAWAKALRRAGVLTAAEGDALTAALTSVAVEFRNSSFAARPSDEDIHTAVERRVTELAGAVGGKLHTGRSRNDQVATDLALWLRRTCGETAAAAAALQRELVVRASAAGQVAVPAYTHLQRGQPVLLAHHLLAYVEMLARDRVRLTHAADSAGAMPLGCGAATGTGVAIDREALAADLGFPRVARNSMDAVASRDAAIEFLSACLTLGLHLSRLGEDIVLWASAEFGFVRLSDTIATGSSLMPQKKNPDGAELARGKAGRLLGNLVTLATALKGLPLAYNKDLQEDKEAVFDTADTIRLTLDALCATVEGMTIDPARCAAALAGGHHLATEVADYLVRKGVPFRTAHGIAGELVREAEAAGVDVSALPLERYRKASAEFGDDTKQHITVEAALRARSSTGGTSPARVADEIARWTKDLGL